MYTLYFWFHFYLFKIRYVWLLCCKVYNLNRTHQKHHRELKVKMYKMATFFLWKPLHDACFYMCVYFCSYFPLFIKYTLQNELYNHSKSVYYSLIFMRHFIFIELIKNMQRAVACGKKNAGEQIKLSLHSQLNCNLG